VSPLLPSELPVAVSFDFGMTLAELDTEFLVRRLAERGTVTSLAAIDAAVPAAWRAYDDAVRRGESGHPWKLLMRTMLGGAGVGEPALEPLVDWLWDEQPRENLWRRPIPRMIELVDELRAHGVRVCVTSNSEGRLAELVDQLGWADRFVCVADSGKLGLEKPGRAIFEWVAARLGVELERIVHVGDSRSADVAGALAAGMFAVWFGPAAGASKEVLPERARAAAGEPELRKVLRGWGFALGEG
jgi:putative hydrolase of the HAD superfamily